ncbi:nwd2 [Moniliophthora roreri MCA 2997]|uniref:Nwd2 n=1 Tax=Moniliophthora roreri (strain MCA 2997) TaxID=1381753 RepID=V2X234_MONRO|nr:nwd2 [Moniliophthora roreri MCA 2997]
MAFNRSNVNVARDAKNIVYGDQVIYGSISSNLDDAVSEATLKSLAQRSAPNACHDSEQRSPPPNCHPGTRTRILEELSQWFEDSSKTTKVFWFHGSAGIGKSAIAQNLAEKYAGKKVAATFFFSRNDTTRDNLAPFVASIAYQFATSGCLRPLLGPAIIKAIRSDPTLFHKSYENQFEKLIIEPCSELEMTNLDCIPNTIIIDGLDECIDHLSQERLLGIIYEATTVPRIPVPWVFLIFSRPEPQIRDAFDDFRTILRSFDFNSSDEAHRDIQMYFTDQFAILRKKHRRALRHEGTSWPNKDAIDQLVDRADGQFIFAVTVVKYIDTRDERPQDRLDTILRIYVERESESPYSDLDLLYRQILSTCHRWEKVRSIMEILVTPHKSPLDDSVWEISWRSPAIIAFLLDLQTGEVEAILSRLHSVLRMPEDDDHDIHITHASFTEFLSDRNRSGEYYTPEMSSSNYFDCVAVSLLRTFSTLKLHYPLCYPQSEFITAFSRWERMLRNDPSRLIHYSHHYWRYCKEVESPSADLIAALSSFDPCSFIAACMFHGFDLYLYSWEIVTKWAKSFGKSTQCFVEKWEPFFQGVCVAFPPVISPQKALWWTFDFERHLCHDPYPRRMFLQELYSINQAAMKSYPKGHTFLVLPADNRVQLPKDWIVTHATKNNGEAFMKVSRAFYAFENCPELLLDDVWDDTCKTVLRDWIKEDDLTNLKLLLKDRAEIFGIPLRRRTIKARGTNRKQE